MQTKRNINKLVQGAVTLFSIVLTASAVSAELNLESVYPDIGLLGQDMEVTLTGSGFDENTRITMYLDVGNRETIIGVADTPGFAHDVMVVGNIAYVADQATLQVVDVSNPTSPVIIGSVDTPGRELTVVGGTAYVADDERGLQIIDISNPSSPVIIGSVDTPSYAGGVTVIGNKAYVADGLKGLQVIDISNRENPKIIGTVDTPSSAEKVTVIGNTAYVADYGSGLQIIDVSNPSSPVIIGSVDTPGCAESVAVVEDTVYLADGEEGLQIIDVSNPASLAIIGTLDTPGTAKDIAVTEGLAYVADRTNGLQVIDISNPESAVIIASVPMHDSTGVTVVGNTAYVADMLKGLKVIDVSNLSSPSAIIGSVDTPGHACALSINGDTAYVADDGKGLQIIDVTHPSNPVIIGSVNTKYRYVHDVAVRDDTIYLANGLGGLQIIDASSPSEPVIIGSADTPGIAHGIMVTEDTAYVADYESGLQIIDVSNPFSPFIIGSVDTPGGTWEVAVAGNTAYVADDNLQVIDVSNPSNPAIIGGVQTTCQMIGLTVIGDIAYVANSSSGLQIVDVSNPANPFVISSIDTFSASKVTVVGDTAYTADYYGGLQVIDVSDISNPVSIGSSFTKGTARDVRVVGDTAYVADGRMGLSVVPVPVEIKPVSLISEATLSLFLPSPRLPGRYTLRSFDSETSHELIGAVTFVAVQAPPISVTAKAGKDSVRLTWEPAASRNSVSHYNIHRSLSYTGPYTKVNADPVTGVIYTDASDLIDETTYYYYLTTVDPQGSESGRSDVASVFFGTVKLLIPDTGGDPGEQVRVPVTIANADGIRICGLDISVTYDPDVISPAGIERTPLSSAYDWALDTETPGVVRASVLSESDIREMLRGEGTLFHILFDVTGSRGENAELRFQAANTSVHDCGEGQEPEPLNLDLTDTGLFTVGGCLLGDMDRDGDVDSQDAGIALLIASGRMEPTEDRISIGDVSGDGFVRSNDAALILRIAEGLPLAPEFSGEERRLVRSSLVNVSIPETSVPLDGSVWVPVEIDNAAGIMGGDIVVNFDPFVVTAADVRASGMTEGFDLAFNTDQAGQIRISFSASQGSGLPQGAGTLLEMAFAPRPQAAEGDVSRITLTGVRLNDTFSRDFATSALQRAVRIADGSVTVGDVPDAPPPDLGDAIRALEVLAGMTGERVADVTGDNRVGPEDVIHMLKVVAGERSRMY